MRRENAGGGDDGGDIESRAAGGVPLLLMLLGSISRRSISSRFGVGGLCEIGLSLPGPDVPGGGSTWIWICSRPGERPVGVWVPAELPLPLPLLDAESSADDAESEDDELARVDWWNWRSDGAKYRRLGLFDDGPASEIGASGSD